MRELILILPNIRSTYNVGSILRNADCFGVKHVYYCGYTPYPKLHKDNRLPHVYNKITTQIAKSALGAEETVSFSFEPDILSLIQKLKNNGYEIVSIEQSPKSQQLSGYEPGNKIALILGNEVEGIDKDILEKSDVILEIPLLGNKESLNVSSTSAIVLYILRYSTYD